MKGNKKRKIAPTQRTSEAWCKCGHKVKLDKHGKPKRLLHNEGAHHTKGKKQELMSESRKTNIGDPLNRA